MNNLFPNRLKIKIKLSSKKIFKYLMIIVVLLTIGSIFYTANYLYDHFYLVITESQVIVLSDDNISIDTINIKKFDNLIKNIEDKTNSPASTIPRNIFH